MVIRNLITKSTYFDSVTLMAASNRMRCIRGVTNAAVMMGTDHNRQLMQNAGLLGPSLEGFTPNDVIMGILAETEDAADAAASSLHAFFEEKTAARTQTSKTAKALSTAKKIAPAANLAIVSVPGRYAKSEAAKALSMGMHVLLFSDNVPLEDEVELKTKALEMGLLMMGPDCGTAIINGKGLGFANVVRRGGVGIVAAAGTGLQEVSVLIDRFGGGISQALGTGGRDLKQEIGGNMMLMELEALRDDPETKVIVIISKPAHPEVMKKIISFVGTIKKPVIACILGSSEADLAGSRAIFAKTLEDAARLAAELSGDGSGIEDLYPEEAIREIAKGETRKMSPTQSCLRGLYTGGTLCYEAILAMRKEDFPVCSNVAGTREKHLSDPEKSVGHTLLDMGDDYFTNGNPHPMIDPRQRNLRIIKESHSSELAVLLLDFVCGYGGHPDPVGEALPFIREARQIVAARGGYLSVVASVCATENDPQKRSVQERRLQESGVRVMPSNQKAAALVCEILKELAQREESVRAE